MRLTFGPESRLSLDIGVFTPVPGGPFPAGDPSGGTPPARAVLQRLPQGPNQGRGENVLLCVGPAPPAATALRRRPHWRAEARGSPEPPTAASIATARTELFRRGYAQSCSTQTPAPRIRRAEHGRQWAFPPRASSRLTRLRWAGGLRAGLGRLAGRPTTSNAIRPSTRRRSSSPAPRGREGGDGRGGRSTMPDGAPVVTGGRGVAPTDSPARGQRGRSISWDK